MTWHQAFFLKRTEIKTRFPDGPLYWAQLAAVLGGVKLYYGSSILIKNYPTLSAAIGGWDGVDAK